VADTARTAVDRLIDRMYRSRGYLVASDRANRPAGSSMTLEAVRGAATIGTLTVHLAEQHALNAETLYASEIRPYRQTGRRLCEFNRLAMHTGETSKEALAAIFHIGMVLAHRIYDATDLFIEVNPRHAPFYRRKIGFNLIGEERICPRVNAPAMLLHKDLAICAEEVSQRSRSLDPGHESFYTFALTPEEENRVLHNILAPLRMAS
jgi:hypothetical protein